MSNHADNTESDAATVAATAHHPNGMTDTVAQDPDSLSHAAELSGRDLRPPATVPGYQIVRRIGEGGFGSVWLAIEANTGKQVAIKFYSHRRGLDWSLLNREVEKLAVLYTSRNIVGLLDVGWNSDPPYYVMEHLENGSLATLLEQGPLPVPDAVRMARSILHALVHAHGSGILHCDLKPANVLLDKDFEPRLCDFGQSRLTDEQSPALGTLFFMAPEQADLKAIPDARWDVYAMGALLYQMLVGEVPYRTTENERRIREAGGLEQKLAEYRKILTESPKPNAHRTMRGVDHRLADLVDRCLSIDPKHRIPNAQAVLDRLNDRERHRARRPMVILGVAFPVILLLLLLPVANKAGGEAVEASSQTLTKRALESDVLTANVMAHSIQRDLEDRRDELSRISKEIDLAKALASLEQEVMPAIQQAERNGATRDALAKLRESSWPKRKQILEQLELEKKKGDERRRGLRRSMDRSWFLTDAAGFQRWRDPVDYRNTLDVQFNFRDYFHGLGREYKRGETPPDLKPIQRPHISLAFRSLSTKKFMIAISVPVRKRRDDGTPGAVVGVLARTMHLGDLLADYASDLPTDKSADVKRSVALVENADGRLLDHPWMTPGNLKELEQRDRNFKALSLPPAVQQKLRGLEDRHVHEVGHTFAETTSRSPAELAGATSPDIVAASNDSYLDPVGAVDLPSAGAYGGVWLAAFAPVADTGWTVIVQERKSTALEPIDEIRHGLITYGLWALLIFIGLIVIVWATVVWRLEDRSRRWRWRRLIGGSHSTTDSSTASTSTSTNR